MSKRSVTSKLSLPHSRHPEHQLLPLLLLLRQLLLLRKTALLVGPETTHHAQDLVGAKTEHRPRMYRRMSVALVTSISKISIDCNRILQMSVRTIRCTPIHIVIVTILESGPPTLLPIQWTLSSTPAPISCSSGAGSRPCTQTCPCSSACIPTKRAMEILWPDCMSGLCYKSSRPASPTILIRIISKCVVPPASTSCGRRKPCWSFCSSSSPPRWQRRN